MTSTSKTTWNRKALRAIANENGIIKGKSISVKIWEDGTITRADTALTLCRKMTVRETVRALNLK
jgi:hypothetical protein